MILLIDEYDVPLARAGEKGYYTGMLDIIKGIKGGKFADVSPARIYGAEDSK